MSTNFNDVLPAAPAGSLNVKWQTDGSGNDSAYVPGAGQAPLSINSKPLAPNVNNDEFEASSLDPSWTVVANTANTVDFSNMIPGSVFLKFTANQGYVIGKPYIPGSTDFSVTLKCGILPASNYDTISIQMSDTLSDAFGGGGTINCNGVFYGFTSNPVLSSFKFVAGTRTDGPSAIPSGAAQFSEVYLHVQRIGGVWSTWFSFDGGAFAPMSPPSGGFGTPTVAFVVIAGQKYGSTSPSNMSVDFVRWNQLTL